MFSPWTLLAAGLLGAVSLSRAEEPPRRTIRVTGEGKASSAPDMAVIHTGVVTQAPTAAEAVAANNEQMQKIMATLKELKIADKDIQTSNFNVQPVYEQNREQRVAPRIAAYQVSNQVQVKVRKLTDLGRALDALVSSGSNQLNGVSFQLADPKPVLDQARAAAVADAQERAALYAKAAGVRVGEVLTISEESESSPQPIFKGRAMAMEAASAVPISAGELDFPAQIHMVFSLDSD
jgi:uncharacterized protein